MSMADDDSGRKMQNREREQKQEELLLPGLPNEISASCIARVPSCYYPTLSAVSKPWRSLLLSNCIVPLCKNLKLRHSHLYIMTRYPQDYSCSWFILPGNPSRKKCIQLPPMPTNPVGAACVGLGTKLFVLGGSVQGLPTSSVLVFDIQHRSWTKARGMGVRREFCTAAVFDEKIYVLGGSMPTALRSLAWAEFYDPVAQTWESIAGAPENQAKWMHGSAVLCGRVFAMSDIGGVVYDPENYSWGSTSPQLNSGWRGAAAVVDGILYSYDTSGKIKGYDPLRNRWFMLEGVEEYLPKFLSGATLANVSGVLHVIWETRCMKETDFVCAAIYVCKDSDGFLRGKILWSRVILSVPQGTSIVHCLSV